MRLTAALCLLVLSKGCGGDRSSDPIQTKSGKDSPIVISDGSTHLRYSGPAGDFQIATTTGMPATISEAGYTITGVKCTGIDCSSLTNLSGTWTMQVFDNEPTPVLVKTVVSQGVSSGTQTLVATYSVNKVSIRGDASGDADNSDGKKGTDIAYAGGEFNSIVFNGTTINCPATPPGGTKPSCKISLKYHHP